MAPGGGGDDSATQSCRVAFPRQTQLSVVPAVKGRAVGTALRAEGSRIGGQLHL